MENSRNFNVNLIGPSTTILNSHRGSTDGLFSQSGGLTRYHSAPSSTFSALLEPDFYSINDNAELVQFLTQSGLSDFSGYGEAGLSLKSNLKQASFVKKEQTRQMYLGQSDVLVRHSGRAATNFPEHIGQGPLSAILEHAGEETLVSEPACQPNPTASTSHEAMMDSSSEDKSNLVRQSSLPTDFLSRLAMVNMSERPLASQQAGSHMQATSQQVSPRIQSTSPRTIDNSGGKVYLVTSRMSPRGVPVKKCFVDEVGPCKEEEYGALDNELNQQCGLLRQSSSPAGLLSQLSNDEFANGCTDKVAMAAVQGLVNGGWDEASMDSAMQNIAALGQRKRGREVDARLLKSLPAADLMMGSLDQITTPTSNHYSVLGASNGDCMVTDSVLCKSRAKRGFATHPRSIAERVRRTKISERIKKLQDLVPNLDKQAHTADMLDEVVEYVKLLQRQVEELSKHSDECNGMCQKNGTPSVET